MFDKRKIRKEMKQVRRNLNQIDNDYSKFVRQAISENKSQDDIRQREDEWHYYGSAEKTRIDELLTQLFRIKADKYDIELPDYSETKYWEEDYGRKRLTRLGRQHVRELIRNERQERWEFFMKVTTLLTGLGGVIIGILSITCK
ncbi:hypothetical protein LLH00_04805 [bacterium]|nr:hypothetical protein [bacterium]